MRAACSMRVSCAARVTTTHHHITTPPRHLADEQDPYLAPLPHFFSFCCVQSSEKRTEVKTEEHHDHLLVGI